MPPAVLGVDNNAEHEVVEDESGKLLERSQQDGELYSKPTVGIIYPPPEVRNIVDRTANFVARNGPEFEDRIRSNEATNPKFNFLNPNDPYYAYYLHKLKEYREGDLTELPSVAQTKEVKAAQKQKVTQVFETIIPKDPPPNYEFMIDPPTISAIDLDIVKLTAQFVAKNGKGFLTNLMTREQRNYQFDFLRPQHSLFQYFTRLVEQYTKVLLPPADICKTLANDVMDCWKILDRVKYRVEWQRYQDREKRKEEDVKERERIAFAQIDWHDFVVVETVNFREDETSNLPPPVTKDQLGARLLAQERFEKSQDSSEPPAEVNDEMDVEEDAEEELYQPFQQEEKPADEKEGSDMEEESDADEDEVEEEPEKESQMPPPVAPPPMIPSNVTIRKNYDPKVKPSTLLSSLADQFLISPLTGEKVPVESMAAHMKINLLDPRWKEQKEKAIEEKRQQEQVFAEGVHIGDTLKQLAERRSDIFGVGAEETYIGKKLGEEEGPKKSGLEIWDGHTASMERTTKLAHSNITFEDQIKAIHRSKGLLPSEDAEKIGPAIPNSTASNTEPSKSFVQQTPVSKPFLLPQAPAPVSIQSTISQPIFNQSAQSGFSQTTQPENTSITTSIPSTPSIPPPATQLIQPISVTPQLPPQPPVAPGIPAPQPQSIRMAPPTLIPLPHTMMMPPPRLMVPPLGSIFPAPPILQPVREEAPLILPPPKDDDEPQSKKSKLDETDTELVSEAEFLQNNKLPVTFRVQVPEIPEKPEWQCQGQVISITLPLTTQCSVIKSKINDMIGMPAGKQKLQIGNFFIKDSNTLAYYNFSPTSLVQLQVKERGGRKK
ncbi:splicing factor 3A subunit 1 isoform X1 [Hydra vulgaris]|uniref:Splicing factor 3A subunit 1 n=1 Tax=Hydra vulgaris TaxID=6087 RepID=T2MCG9_HYDVU